MKIILHTAQFHSADLRRALKANEPVHEKTQQFGFPTRSDTNWPVRSQKKARSLKLCIKVGEELYYPCSENKGANQLAVTAQLICVFVFS